MDEVTLLTWRTPHADAAALEAATVALAPLEECLRGLRAGTQPLPNLCYLATCQRVMWVVHGTPAQAEAAVQAVYRQLGRPAPSAPQRHEGFEAFSHLCEVASSLDSLVPGEPQVMAQVKQAMLWAERAGFLGANLRHVFDLVLRTAKAVRSQTRLFEGKVSLIPLARKAMADALETTDRPCAAILGTGEIGTKTAELVRSIRPDVALHIVSRSADRAASAAGNLGGTPHLLESFLINPPPVHLLVLAMEVDAPIVSASWLANQAGRGALTVLDFALPRNAEAPGHAVAGLRLIQLDDLTRLSEQAKAGRDAAFEDAVRVLEDEVDKVRQEYDLRCHASALHKLTTRFLAISEERWQETVPGLDREHPKARKWYEQTVRALLHEAATVVKETPRGGRGP